MKISNFLMMSSAALLLGACGSDAKSGEAGEVASATEGSATYTIDSTSNIGWTGSKLYGIGGSHSGNFNLSEGTISVENGNITAGNFTIDMTSVSVKEMTPETGSEKLIGHLSSPDFFNITEYPTAKFEVTGTEAKADGSYTHVVNGNLTLRDSTRNVSFPATISFEDNKMTATGSLSINRLDWGINYDSDKQDVSEEAIKAIQNGVVDKNVEITLNISAQK